MERVASTVGFSLGSAHFTDLDYADDVALLPHAMDDLHIALEVYMCPGRRRKFRTWVRADQHPNYQSVVSLWRK